MSIPTKFKIGDVVWYAGAAQTTKMHPCPDCRGSRKWRARSPAGGEYEFSCPRCATSYSHHRGMSLSYTDYEPTTRLLTIGQIDVQATADGIKEERYMCNETGVGGGSVYSAKDLFTTQEEALTVAQLKAADLRKQEWVAEIYNKSLELSDYQLDNGILQLAKKQESQTSETWGWLLSDFESCIFGMDPAEDLEKVRAKIKEVETIGGAEMAKEERKVMTEKIADLEAEIDTLRTGEKIDES